MQITKLMPPVAPFRLYSSIILNTLFLNTLRSTFYSLNEQDQVSYPYNATYNIIIL